MNQFIAHIRKISQGKYDKPHLLLDHLIGTTFRAEKSADKFTATKLGKILGLFHDAGKASAAFQKKIRINSGYDAKQFAGQSVPSAPHSDAGAQLLVHKYGPQLGKVAAYCVAGHHGGMPDGLNTSERCLSKRLKRDVDPFKESFDSLGLQLPEKLLPSDFPLRQGSDGFTFAFLIRMLFSCLVDADFLDTEEYMEPEKGTQRESPVDFEKLEHKLNRYIENISKKKGGSPVSQDRSRILRGCQNAAILTPGFFSLTVPTGGGKTLSSMAFALRHAITYYKSRIIYVIPFTSIIEQNAQEFKNALGEEHILEHHASIDPNKESFRSRLAAENWDAPIVVTTNVQFFESLFANKPSKCRKLHNIVNSVIIIDEAQMLAPDYLLPTLRTMQELVAGYACSIVLCTATQPALGKSDAFRDGLEQVREIISSPRKLYEKFRRVNVTIIAESISDEELSEKLLDEKQVLCIVNTRKQTRELFELIGDEEAHFHLSTYMHAAHRSKVLQEIRERLDAGLKCRVVSTQLVEAGVDIDFPTVYRNEAGIDSIAQAAGRCNREGNYVDGGRVFVFKSEKRPPAGLLRQSADAGNQTARLHASDILSLDAVETYFSHFYWKRSKANGLDKKCIIESANEDYNPNLNFPFESMAKDYCLIENNTTGIIIPCETNAELIEELRNGYYPDRLIIRKLQRYMVQLRKEVLADLINAGAIEDMFGDYSILLLSNTSLYDDKKIGLNTEQSYNYDVESLII